MKFGLRIRKNRACKMAKGRLFVFLFLIMKFSFSQIEKIEPPNWWVGMKHSSIELMVYGKDIGTYVPTINYPGVQLKHFDKGDSPNYLFLEIEINSEAKAGDFDIEFSAVKGGSSFKKAYPLLERVDSSNNFIGFNSSDVIYLITPDRFANGNSAIDSIEGLRETGVDRKNNYARHGGDIEGMRQHLEYIKEMGFTAIWPTPLLINDMKEQSYHGYAITDFYKVDPRFGSLKDYILLAKETRSRGMKLIMDQVVNHCGLDHWWMQDLPFKDWVNFQNDFEAGKQVPVTNHRRTINQDIYASKADRDLMNDGWFVPSMPDLNQNNPHLANYLIQNSLWWIESLHLGGIRQDTYPYPEKDFMSKWAHSIMEEYPNFNIVGEEWSYNPLLVAYWQDGSVNHDGYQSGLKTTMDFPLQKQLIASLKEEEAWNSGLIKLYEGLANDFAYYDPFSMMLFGDNHDMDRIYTQLEEDLSKLKMALSFILIAPRIPQIYYGTEVLLENRNKPGDHGLIRTDFPGGWKEDAINAFSGKGLSAEQKDIQAFLKKLLVFRGNSTAIHRGETVHFSPENGIYVLFRVDENEVVMLVLNKNEKAIDLDLGRFSEIKLAGKTFVDLQKNKEIILENSMRIETKGCLILYSKKN